MIDILNKNNVNMAKKLKKFMAFTLAEVLITLTIIGVIASITIPNLMRKWRDHADVAKVKEAYSILSNAYKLCITENGTMADWVYEDGENASSIKNSLTKCMLPYLKVEKYCGSATGCVPNIYAYKTIKDYSDWGTWTDGSNYGKARLQNGMTISNQSFGVDKNGNINSSNMAGADLRVDINGNKGPNKYGYDVFFFVPTPKGLSLPYYTDKSLGTKACTKGDSGSYYTHRLGLSCSAWIIKHGNMDYKYRDVSAEW